MLRSTLFVFLILKEALTQTHAAEVSGYHGETVVLPSRADPTWTLEKIEWWTFANNTLIATYRNRLMNLNRASQFLGRLSLNVSTGDLTIDHVTERDAMEYSVRLVNSKKNNEIHKSKLTVRQRLQEPSVETHVSLYNDGRCAVMLRCSSQEEGVDFSWEAKPPVTLTTALGLLVAVLGNATSPVEFTCTSNTSRETTSTSVTPNCVAEVNPASPTGQNCCNCRYGLCAAVTLILVLVSLVIQIALPCLKDKLCPWAFPVEETREL